MGMMNVCRDMYILTPLPHQHKVSYDSMPVLHYQNGACPYYYYRISEQCRCAVT